MVMRCASLAGAGAAGAALGASLAAAGAGAGAAGAAGAGAAATFLEEDLHHIDLELLCFYVYLFKA